MKTIETERTYLRELHVNDAKDFYQLNADEDVLRYTGDVAFPSIRDAELFLQNYSHYQNYGFGRWAVIDKKTDNFLGWCGLKYTPEKDEVDIGFRFYRKYWGFGYATESAKVCLAYGFEKFNLQRIVGRAMSENSASIRVLEKIGMHWIENFSQEEKVWFLYEIKNQPT